MWNTKFIFFISTDIYQQFFKVFLKTLHLAYESFPVRNWILLCLDLKNTGIAHIMIVQNKTLPFEVLFLK